MEVNSDEIQNYTENPRRNLRKRKKQSYYTDRVVKRRTNNNRTNRSKKRSQRHRSLDMAKIEAMPTNSYEPRPSTSTGSLKSVIYLGHYRKVPQLITLDESSNSIPNQEHNQEQNLFSRGENSTLLPYSLQVDVDKETGSNQLQDDSTIRRKFKVMDIVSDSCDKDNCNYRWNKTTDHLWNLLRELYIQGYHEQNIVTREKTREFLNFQRDL